MRWTCLALLLCSTLASATTDAIRVTVGANFHKYGGIVTSIEPATAKAPATLYFTSPTTFSIGSGVNTETFYDVIPWTVVFTNPKGTYTLTCSGNVPAFDGDWFLFHVVCDAFPG